MSKILIFGDICPDNNYRPLFDEKRALGADVVADIRDADLVIGNLECPATNITAPIIKTGPNIKALPQDIAYLKELGFDVLSLANNHILDYGTDGLNETLETCLAANIKTFGAGRNVGEAAKPLIVNVGGCKVGLLGYAEEEFNLAEEESGGAVHFDPYESLDEIAAMKAQADILIVLYHGGVEHHKYPSPMLQKKCRKMAEKGADLVLVQHSHCIGTSECVNGSTIVYGQGNSVFGCRNDTSWDEGLLISLDTDTRKIDYRLLHATAEGVVYADEQADTKRQAEFLEDSQHLSDETFINERWLEFANQIKALHMPSIYGKSRLFIHLNRLLGNRLINLFFSKRQKMVTLELFRCEAHHEVMKTIFENELKGYIKCQRSR